MARPADNLLVSLFKYPSGDVSPRENFFTECFRYILTSDAELRGDVMMILEGKSATLREPISVISHPPKMGDSMPDLMFVDKIGRRLFAEIKVESKENVDNGGRRQLRKYLDDMSRNDRLVFIANRDEKKYPKDRRFIGRAAWSSIYRVIHDYRVSKAFNPVTRFIIDNFLALMRSMKMDTVEFKKSEGFLGNIDSVTLLKKCERFLKQTFDEQGDLVAALKQTHLKKKGIGVSLNGPGRKEPGYDAVTYMWAERKKQKRKLYLEIGFFFTDSKAKYWDAVSWLKYAGKPRTGACFYIELWTDSSSYSRAKKKRRNFSLNKKYFPHQFIDEEATLGLNYIYLPDLTRKAPGDLGGYIRSALHALEPVVREWESL